MSVEPIRFWVVEDFLTNDEHDTLLRIVRNNESFVPAQVTEPGAIAGGANERHRRASVASVDDDVFGLFEDKLTALLPHARREVSVDRFALGAIERQITAHDDGDFFTAHTDVGDPYGESGARRLSYVYYFNNEPRGFEGGELVLFDQTTHDDGTVEVAETFQVVEPVDNTIVFFSSNAMHEVRPVRVTGEHGAPGTRRYTVNGWFRDRDHVAPEPALDPPTRTALAQRYTPSFTEVGFKKVETPPAVHRAMQAVYHERFEQRHTEGEDSVHMPTGTPDFINIDDVKDKFHFALQSIHEEWSGVELLPTAAYGLRVYRSGQTLIPHTDRLSTHVISSIVHIAHDTVDPWPLWIIDIEGNEHEIVLEEGEMLLYESARCPHARPKPLNGDTYCSIFLHYKPVDWNVTYRSLVELAQADGATDVLPPELWPEHLAASSLPAS